MYPMVVSAKVKRNANVNQFSEDNFGPATMSSVIEAINSNKYD